MDYSFYLLFPDIQIVNTCVHYLSWSHIRRIQYLIWQPSAAKLQLSISQDTIDIECFSLQKCSPMASKLQMSEELRNVLPDMDEMRKLLINESDTDN